MLAANWSGAAWEVPDPGRWAVAGARLHDLCWEAWDDQPACDGNGVPLSFNALSRSVTTEFYRLGIDGLELHHPAAALLKSLHLSGFFHSHFGWPVRTGLAGLPLPERSDVEIFVAGELARQRRLTERLELPPDEVALAYRWLQLWDLISLAVARDGFEGSRIELPGVEHGGHVVSITIRLDAPHTIRLDPYPFRTEPLELGLWVHRFPRRVWPEDGFQRDWEHSSPSWQPVRLMSGPV